MQTSKQQNNLKHFLTGEELTTNEIWSLLALAQQFKINAQKNRGIVIPTSANNNRVVNVEGLADSSVTALDAKNLLNEKTIALVFEKPSLRTRVSFTVGIQELGGHVVELTSGQKKNEDPEDSIRVLQGMVHGVMVRTFEHEILERMVSKATVPVINGLSDLHHPCQALADLQTLAENFDIQSALSTSSTAERVKLAYVGDGNNVLHSLLLLLPRMGVDVHYACPQGYKPNPQIIEKAIAQQSSGQIHSFKTPQEAVRGVHAIYTDVWTSMGQEEEAAARESAFAGYQVDEQLLSLARADAIVMHCLPMVKGKEISAAVVENTGSRIFAQAENRLHAQKALLCHLFQE